MKIAIVSDGPNVDSGYGSLGRALINGFFKAGVKIGEKIELSYISFQHLYGPLIYRAATGYDVPVYSGSNQYLMDLAYEKIRPDILIHIRDPFVHVPRYFSSSYTFSNYMKNTFVVGYLMAMYDVYDDSVSEAIRTNYHLVYSSSAWGKKVFTMSGVPTNMLEVLYPFIDDLPWYVDAQDCDAPHLMYVAVPDDRRKNIPILFEYLKNLDDYHLNLVSADGTFAISMLAKWYAEGRVHLPRGYLKGQGISKETLVSLYKNSCYVSPSSLEGINMPALEAASLGRPVVLTDLPHYREYFEDATYLKTVRA